MFLLWRHGPQLNDSTPDTLDRILVANERHSKSRESTAVPSVAVVSKKSNKSQEFIESDSDTEANKSDNDDNLSHFGAMQSGRRAIPPRVTNTRTAESMSPELVDTGDLPRQMESSVRGSVTPTPSANDKTSVLEQTSPVVSANVDQSRGDKEEDVAEDADVVEQEPEQLVNGDIELPGTPDAPHDPSPEKRKKKKKKRKSVNDAHGIEPMALDQSGRMRLPENVNSNDAGGPGPRPLDDLEPQSRGPTTDSPHKKKKKKHRKDRADVSVLTVDRTSPLQNLLRPPWRRRRNTGRTAPTFQSSQWTEPPPIQNLLRPPWRRRRNTGRTAPTFQSSQWTEPPRIQNLLRPRRRRRRKTRSESRMLLIFPTRILLNLQSTL